MPAKRPIAVGSRIRIRILQIDLRVGLNNALAVLCVVHHAGRLILVIQSHSKTFTAE